MRSAPSLKMVTIPSRSVAMTATVSLASISCSSCCRARLLARARSADRCAKCTVDPTSPHAAARDASSRSGKVLPERSASSADGSARMTSVAPSHDSVRPSGPPSMATAAARSASSSSTGAPGSIDSTTVARIVSTSTRNRAARSLLAARIGIATITSGASAGAIPFGGSMTTARPRRMHVAAARSSESPASMPLTGASSLAEGGAIHRCTPRASTQSRALTPSVDASMSTTRAAAAADPASSRSPRACSARLLMVRSRRACSSITSARSRRSACCITMRWSRASSSIHTTMPGAKHRIAAARPAQRGSPSDLRPEAIHA